MQKSFVWKYFAREGAQARCKVEGCNSLLGAKATTSLIYHLKSVHKIIEDKRPDRSTNAASTSQIRPQEQEVEEQRHEEPKTKKQKTILDCFSFKSLEETVTRMVAEDGITIRQITRSSFIQQSLAKEFPKRNIPRSENGMMALVESFYAQAKEQLKKKLGNLKTNDGKFSATLDEWTSMKNVRYININLHYSVGYNKTKYMNLGMVKIVGSCSADDMLSLVSSYRIKSNCFDNFSFLV